MSYHILAPEVAGGMGPGTVLDSSVHPPSVSKLEYEFFGWFGDELLESFPCFIVSDRLGEALRNASLSGFILDEVVITLSEQFNELHPNIVLPQFFWLRVFGRAGTEDIGVTRDARLVVSERALQIMRNFSLEHCEISDFA
jgi:hypothetical protein